MWVEGVSENTGGDEGERKMRKGESDGTPGSERPEFPRRHNFQNSTEI